METVLEMDTMNAVPTPRLEVGEKQLAAQLLEQSVNVFQSEFKLME